MILQLSFVVVVLMVLANGQQRDTHQVPKWVVNHPKAFYHNGTHHVSNLRRCKDDEMAPFEEMQHNINLHLTSQDGEGLDAIEHFFWGMVGGVVMELGALDGKAASVSRDFLPLQWKRVLIDGNPIYIDGLITESADAFSAVAAVCAQPQFVHYLPGPYVGGIVEFMTPEFIKKFHKYNVWDRTVPRGNLSSIDWTDVDSDYLGIREMHCLPLSDILHEAHVRHVNLFVLDTEGSELQILESINFKIVRFDVICVETEKTMRPPGYGEQMNALLESHDYKLVVTDGQEGGRNSW